MTKDDFVLIDHQCVRYSSCIDFLADHDSKRHITIEYILIKDINDSYEDAKSLVSLLSTFPCKINLIPFNKFEGSDYERPSNKRIAKEY